MEWDYQTFVSPESPDVEVGIFAITRDRIMERLQMLQDVGITPDFVHLSPVAAYNALAYDLQFSEQTPGTFILDVGTTSTDVIIAESGRVWVRTFPIGGHQFTDALVNTFKLTYPKAEKLKREADEGPNARHVFQAMRSVFTDLAQDVQRSIGYYQSLHKDAKIVPITSSVSMLQPGIAFLEEGLRLDRRKSSAALMLVTLGGSLFVAYYSRGLEALDTMDFWAGTFFIFVLAIFQVIVAGWLFGVENVLAEAQEGSRMRIPRSLPRLIKYISPAFLLTIFVMWCVQYIPDQWKKIQTNTVTQITVLLLLGTLIALVIATHFALRYWQRHRRPGGVA